MASSPLEGFPKLDVFFMYRLLLQQLGLATSLQASWAAPLFSTIQIIYLTPERRMYFAEDDVVQLCMLYQDIKWSNGRSGWTSP